MSYQPDIDNIYFICRWKINLKKISLLIKKRESIVLKHHNASKAFFEYSSDTGNIYKKINKYNTGKKQKMLIIFHNMFADLISKKNLIC